MIGHLGTRASALLDGQLPAAEADRLWSHVHGCHLCRDLVEREGWVKTRLSGLGAPDRTQAPDHLKGALLGAGALDSPYARALSGHAPSAPSTALPVTRPRRAGRQPHPAHLRQHAAAGRAPDPSLTR